MRKRASHSASLILLCVAGLCAVACTQSDKPSAVHRRVKNAIRECESAADKQREIGSHNVKTFYIHCLKDNVMPLQLPYYAMLEPQIRAMYDHLESMAVISDNGGPVTGRDIVDYYNRQTVKLGLQSPNDCFETASGQMQCQPHQQTYVPTLPPRRH